MDMNFDKLENVKSPVATDSRRVTVEVCMKSVFEVKHSPTCRGCRSTCYFLKGFWLRSVQLLPRSSHHTMRVWPGWWCHEPPQQTELPWQQLGFHRQYSLTTQEQEK